MLDIMKTENHITELSVENPFTGEEISRLAFSTIDDIPHISATATIGALKCRNYSRAERSRILSAAAHKIELQKEDFTNIIVSESGKTITQARKEVARCINTLTLSAEEAKRNTGEMIPFDSYAGNEQRFGYFTREPLGQILAITPFNDPLNLVAHKIGPAIAGGNSVVLKPSGLTPLSAIKLVDTLREAGLDNAIITVVCGGNDMGKELVKLPKVRMVSFTGGIATGEEIIATAGLKKHAMDLGGNAPVIVLADCNLMLAVDACVSGAFWASGQNCIGVQRVLVEKSVFKKFVKSFVSKTESLIVGDPAHEDTDVGPMITSDNAKLAQRRVERALDEGAELLTGHKRDGSFYWPTVLTNVQENSDVRKCEIFAPIVIIEHFTSLKQAVNQANESEYSLHAGIFTNDLNTALTVSDQLDVGGVMINDSSDFRFDGMPFGGFKYGSMGREGVRFSVEEMTQPKVVCFNKENK